MSIHQFIKLPVSSHVGEVMEGAVNVPERATPSYAMPQTEVGSYEPFVVDTIFTGVAHQSVS